MHLSPDMPESESLHRLRKTLAGLGNPTRGALAERFFKTGPGQYAEGDRFLGIPVPELRRLVREHRSIPPEEASLLVRSPWNEERLCGLLLWMEAWKAAKAKGLPELESRDRKRQIKTLLLEHKSRLNNWNLVDTAVPTLLGEWLLEFPDPSLLENLAASKSLWDRRIAVLATFAFIRADRFEECFRLCEALLDDPEDLMHKACGWMLREAGKRDIAALRQFLSNHASRMPRTMLRYAIEKMTPQERARWMGA
ncbi:MAG: hypothetical protein RL318_1023 [Fibrobacterota bacterium]|jgi:hypothetical protein